MIARAAPSTRSPRRPFQHQRSPKLRAVPKVAASLTPRITHVAFHVRDLKASKEFYEEFCGVKVYREGGMPGKETLWLSEPGLEGQFVYVMFAGSKVEPQANGDFSHVGLAVDSKEAVDAVAKKAESRGILAFGPKEMPYPVGYVCMINDPDGRLVEFSYGQPLSGRSEGLLV